MLIMKYRIMGSHCEDPFELEKEFDADSDAEAIKEWERIKSKPSYTYYTLYRVDVVEEITYLAPRSNSSQD